MFIVGHVGLVVIRMALSQNRRYRIGISDFDSRRVLIINFLRVKRSIFVFILNVEQDIVLLQAWLKT